MWGNIYIMGEERGRNQTSCRGTKWARYFASKLVCYIGKGREIKDPLEQRKYIFPVTIDIGNINMAVQQRRIILYTCRGVRNLPQQVASWVIFTVPPPWNLTYMRRISPPLQPLRVTPSECSLENVKLGVKGWAPTTTWWSTRFGLRVRIILLFSCKNNFVLLL